LCVGHLISSTTTYFDVSTKGDLASQQILRHFGESEHALKFNSTPESDPENPSYQDSFF
jgi:hypothetical protein